MARRARACRSAHLFFDQAEAKHGKSKQDVGRRGPAASPNSRISSRNKRAWAHRRFRRYLSYKGPRNKSHLIAVKRDRAAEFENCAALDQGRRHAQSPSPPRPGKLDDTQPGEFGATA